MRWYHFILVLMLLLQVSKQKQKTRRNSRFYRCDYDYRESGKGFFKLHEIPAIWVNAQMRCHMEGAILATPMFSRQLETIISIMKKHDIKPYGIFMGLRREHRNFSGLSDFYTVDGYSLQMIMEIFHGNLTWDAEQPDNLNNDQYCVNLRPNRKMSDEPCSFPAPYICYKAKTDVVFNFTCGTTDTHPVYGYQQITTAPHCYKLHRYRRTWRRAAMQCYAEGGWLVVPDDQLEINNITRILWKDKTLQPQYGFYNKSYYYEKYHIYIGFSSLPYSVHPGDYREYLSIKGEYIEHTDYVDKWSYKRLEPRVARPEEDTRCILLENRYSKYVTGNCFELRHFMCEKPPKNLNVCEPMEKPYLKWPLPEGEDPLFRCDYEWYVEGYGWYKFHKRPLIFKEAAMMCRMEGAELASPTYVKMKHVMLHIMNLNNVNAYGVFTGINCLISQGDFHTIDGTPLHKINFTWDEHQPDNIKNNQSCLTLRPNGMMADEECHIPTPYICFKSYEPLNKTACGMTNLALLPAQITKTWYTSGLMTDYKEYEGFDNCVKFQMIARSWDRAKQACHADRGRLLTFKEAMLDQKFLRKHIRDFQKYHYQHTFGWWPGIYRYKMVAYDAVFIGGRKLQSRKNETISPSENVGDLWVDMTGKPMHKTNGWCIPSAGLPLVPLFRDNAPYDNMTCLGMNMYYYNHYCVYTAVECTDLKLYICERPKNATTECGDKF